MDSLTSSLRPAAALGRQILLLSGLMYGHHFSVLQQTGKESPHTLSALGGQETVRDWCRTRPNEYGQQQCRGCDEVCSLLRWGEVQRRKDSQFRGCSQSRFFHSNFRELDMCATLS